MNDMILLEILKRLAQACRPVHTIRNFYLNGIAVNGLAGKVCLSFSQRSCAYSKGAVLFPVLVMALVLASTLVLAAARPLPSFPAEEPILNYGFVEVFENLRFTEPVGIVAAPGETNSLFIVERKGRIIVIPDLQNPSKEVFLNLDEATYASYGEAGLLGLAFHPDYQSNGRFFVYRTTSLAGEGLCDVLSEFHRDPLFPHRAKIDSELIYIKQRDGSVMHNAGDLHFGPDGYLYLSLGDDAPVGSDAHEHWQAIDKGFFGGIIRIDVDNRPGNLPPHPHPAVNPVYSVPNDNPFIGVTNFNGRVIDSARVRTEFFAVGFRNPWRFTFHPLTGALICADVGQGLFEEVSIIQPGGNYGWPFFEALYQNTSIPEEQIPGIEFKPPLYHYRHGYGVQQGNVVIGGHVYEGHELPGLQGKYIFADNATGNTWALDPSAVAPQAQWLTARKGISSFGVDPRNQELLMANVEDGGIYKLIFVSPEESGVPQTLAATGTFADTPSLSVSPLFQPYEINTPFWSDNALKQRWFSLAMAGENQQMRYDPLKNWTFPPGSVWIKHFDLETTLGDPSTRQRVETRFIIKTSEDVYGLSYHWENPTNAILVPPQGMEKTFEINDGGIRRFQKWQFPSWQQCKSCHTEAGGYIIGFNTFQLNREGPGSGNYLEWLAENGYFQNPDDLDVATAPRLFSLNDTNAPVQTRVRSWLHANCVQCHQPGGPGLVRWDARITTALKDAHLLNAWPSGSYQHVPMITPNLPDDSMLYRRANSRFPAQMPPFATSIPDAEAMALLQEWIRNIPEESWESEEMGIPVLESSGHEADNILTISGSGLGLAHGKLFYFYKRATGFTSISALLRTNRTDASAAEGGLMLKSGIGEAENFAALYSSQNQVIFRISSGGEHQVVAEMPAAGPVWLRLLRERNNVTAYLKTMEDGTWRRIASAHISLPQNLLAGLFSAAGEAGAIFNNAVFEEVEIDSLDLQFSWLFESGSLRIAVQHSGDRDINLWFESSQDLLNWSLATGEITTNTLPNGDLEVQYHTHPFPVGQQFIRTRAEPQDAPSGELEE